MSGVRRLVTGLWLARGIRGYYTTILGLLEALHLHSVEQNGTAVDCKIAWDGARVSNLKASCTPG